MPVAVCPHCSRPLTYKPARAGLAVLCRYCRGRMRLPAGPPDASAELQGFESLTAGEESSAPPRRGRRGRGRSTAAVWLVSAAVLASAGLAVAGYLAHRSASERELESALTDFLLLANRADSVSDQIQFWLLKELEPSLTKDLEAEGDRMDRRLKEMNAGIEARWGRDHPGLGRINPARSERFNRLRKATAEKTAALLGLHRRQLEAELEATRARIRAEIPLTLTEVPKFDRGTYQGQLDYDDFMKRLPALDRLAAAERNVAVERRYARTLPALREAAVRKAREAIRKEVTALEPEFVGAGPER